MPSRTDNRPSPCHHRDDAVVTSLPVIDNAPTIRPSRMGRRRAVVLATIQILMIAHLIQWAITGTTTTPLEPSESMEFVKRGIVNAGLIMFAIALLSTLILGRFFCGWGCHIVMLQDFCGWMMKKIGLRPKPFRSRLLIYVPLILALYMFIWPAFHRLAVEPWLQGPTRHPPWILESHLVTDDFWATFPGVMVAVPFLLVCGFATVYFLGAKGFCTYGCPYGGFFAPLDEFAPGRIRVTDDCEHCGHCTAVCTSNVRVHDEVREYGMVVDPGCMKCMDCVSVCPNDALYFGFGKPASAKGAPKNEKPKRVLDLTWPEEFAFAAVCAGAFFAVRSVYGVIPMLMAIGIAVCVTFLAWQTWRIIRDENVSFHRMRLKYRSSIKRPGYVMLTISTLAIALTAHSGFIRAARALGDAGDFEITIPMDAVFAPQPAPLDDDTRALTESTLRWYTLASSIPDGGIGLLRTTRWQGPLDIRRAWLLSILGQFTEAREIIDRAIERDGSSDVYETSRFLLLNSEKEFSRAFDHARTILTTNPDAHGLVTEMLNTARRWGRVDQTIEVLQARLQVWPDDMHTITQLAPVLAELGRPAEAEPLFLALVEARPDDITARAELARMLAQQQKYEDALVQLHIAVKQEPNNRILFQAINEVQRLMDEQE